MYAWAMQNAAAPLLRDEDGPAAEVINPGGRGALVLVCEHASRFIPPALADLGLAPGDRESHAAWDIGARDLALHLSEALDAPLVAARVSRLVYDCNRPPEAPDAIPARSEVVEVPGNRNLGEAERAARVRDVYHPFRTLLSRTLDAHPEPFAVVTIHSFTPVYHGRQREVEMGLLHDDDPRLARAMLDAAPAHLPLLTRLNEPYDAADGVTHTLREHAISRGVANVMVEVRNDLLRDGAGIARVGDGLARLLAQVLPGAMAPCPTARA